MRSLILLGMLLPVLGVAGTSAALVEDRLDQRDRSRALEAAADELRQAVGFRAAVAEEEIRSTVVGLARDFGIDMREFAAMEDGEVLAGLAESRAEVDAGRPSFEGSGLSWALDRLRNLRERMDASEVGQDEVAATFAEINDQLSRSWAEQLARIEQIGDRGPLDAGVRARLRTLRQAVIAFELGGPQVNAALQILLREPTREALVQLVAARARAEAATEQAAPVPGTATHAAWQAFADDPAAQRTEGLIELAAGVALGDPAPWAEPPPQALIAGIEDGERWGSLLVAIPEAAAADLAAVAGARADADVAAVRDELVRAAIIVVLTLLAALAIARTIARPARDLEQAARSVEQGDFELPPVTVRGPREVRATVTAFNDMAATLAAVEDQAVALAEDPGTPALDHPLPGRTGQAMQAAIDRLRRSMSDAEDHRAELYQLATHDGLTGLLNRAAAYTEIERELARASRDGRPLLAVYVDLDGLKDLNDTHGHQAGDEAIVRTADALRATTRKADIVARLGGDEFMVVGSVPPGGPEAVLAFAERIHGAVGEQRVPTADGHGVRLRSSVGVALADTAGDTAESLVRAADAAMYLAKTSGRDRVGFADPPAGATPQLV